MIDEVLIPDLRAREEALSPSRSFIVQAPAGSGKTGLLIQRYLGLLATVNEPEEIVAITFTRKAAAEMRERVLEAFAQVIAGRAPASGHERRTLELARAALARDSARGWRISDSPARLRIQTIDSLCAALTRQMPMLSKFGSQPESIEDARALYGEAARATVELIEAKDPAADYIERLLVHLDNNVERVEELLIEMLRRRDHWLRHLMVRQRAGLEGALVAERRAVLEQVQALMPATARGELLAIAIYSLGNRGEAPLAAFPGGGDAQDWARLAEVLLTSNGTWRARVDKRHGFPSGAAGKAWKDRLAAFIATLTDDRLRTALADTRRLPPAVYTDAQWQVLEAITELLKRAVGQLKLVFQSRGQVDFTEVSQRALLALEDNGGPTDLALRLDYQVRHLLIDEFQDTSISQFELLARLTAGWTPDDGRTLFAVGDPMQSIYRFREAEVGLFLKARAEGIGNVVLEPLELSANFRSQAGIVDWVNQAFRQVMPEFENIGSGAVAYTESKAVHPHLPGGAVEIHPLFAGGAASEAEQVVKLVAGVAAAGAKHGPGQSVAILVRGRNHLREIVPQLKHAGLAFRAIEIDRLDDRPVVQDLLALTRALAHRGDRLAWLAILRAPWCGLTLADLHAIAGADKIEAKSAGEAQPEPISSQSTVWELLHDPRRLAALSADARLRLARVRPVLAAALAGRQRSSLRDAVEGTWLALGGPACAGTETDLEDAATYLDHLEAEEEAGAIADFDAFGQGLDKLYALPDMAAGDDAVQIMTIHKAKGLEFDHVIVPGLGKVPPAARKQLFLWMERPAMPDASMSRRPESKTNLLLAPIEETGAESDPIYAWIKQLNADKAAFEDGRLLYVAATRAKQRLHLLGETRLLIEDDAQTARQPDSRSLLAKLWPVVSGEFQRAAATATAATATAGEDGDAVADQSLRRLASAWSLPDAPPALAWRAPGETARVQDDIEYSWVGETARHAGSVVHRWLQKFAEDELQGWSAARIDTMRESFTKELAARGVEEAQLAAAAERVAKALANALADPRGRWLLGPQQDARNEYRLTAMIEGERRNLIIDRSFTDADGKRWIVDYKASGHEGTNVEGFLDQEQERYRMQLARYAHALAQAEPAMLGLYFPLLAGWRQWIA
jgi:ATP-dependent exoDNAse (exonuclease V) beta subunit